MRCPLCDDAEMFILEFEEIELDFCPECRGIWLDSGELELIGQRAGALQGELLSALEQAKGAPPPGRKRRCPVCRKGMARVPVPGEEGVEVDRCPAGHGLWFDHGEIRAVVRAAGAAAENPLTRFFRDLEEEPA